MISLRNTTIPLFFYVILLLGLFGGVPSVSAASCDKEEQAATAAAKVCANEADACYDKARNGIGTSADCAAKRSACGKTENAAFLACRNGTTIAPTATATVDDDCTKRFNDAMLSCSLSTNRPACESAAKTAANACHRQFNSDGTKTSGNFCLAGSDFKQLCIDTTDPTAGVNSLVNIATIIGVFISVVMTASGGLKIATNGANTDAKVKADGLEQIKNSLMGLGLILLARGAVYIAFTAIGIV